MSNNHKSLKYVGGYFLCSHNLDVPFSTVTVIILEKLDTSLP